MSDALIQKGTSVVVGVQGITYGTWVIDSASEMPEGEVKEIRDENNAVMTKLVSNPKKVYELTGIILGSPEATYTLTAARLIIVGTAITLNGATCMVTACKIAYTKEETKITLTAVDEGAM